MNTLTWLIDDVVSVRLTLTLFHFLWQGCVIGIIVIMAGVFLKNASARLRYSLHVTAMALMAACVPTTYFLLDAKSVDFAVAANSDHDRLNPTIQPGPLEQSATPAAKNSPDSNVAATHVQAAVSEFSFSASVDSDDGYATWLKSANIELASSLPSLSRWVAGSYLCGVILVLGRLLLGMLGGHRLRKAATQIADSRLLATVNKLARQVGLRIVPTIAWCEEISVPVVVGMVKPIILLPMELVTGLTASQLEALLLHELSHIRRFDPILNLFQRVIEAFLFFHPVVWFVSRRVSIERENAADDMVLAAGWDRPKYAEALVRVAEIATAVSRPNVAHTTVLGATGTTPSEFKLRILRLLGSHPPKLEVSGQGMLLALILVCASGLMAWSQTGESKRPLLPATDSQNNALTKGKTTNASQNTDWQSGSVVLVNGLKIELESISHAIVVSPEGERRKAEGWWRPDGTKIDASPAGLKPIKVTPTHSRSNFRELSFRVLPISADLIPELSNRGMMIQPWNAQGIVTDGWNANGELRFQIVKSFYDESPGQASLYLSNLPLVKAAVVHLDGRPVPEPMVDAKTMSLFQHVELSGIEKAAGETVLNFKPDRRDERVQVEVTAELRNGKSVKAKESVNERRVIQQPASEIASFSIRLRPMTHMITFSGFSMLPGQKSEPKTTISSLDRAVDIFFSLDGELLGVFSDVTDSKLEAMLNQLQGDLNSETGAISIHTANRASYDETNQLIAKLVSGGWKWPRLSIRPRFVECDVVDAVTGKPVEGTTVSFRFVRPKNGDEPEKIVATTIWGPNAPSQIYFSIPDEIMASPDREKLEVQWSVTQHDAYEPLSPLPGLPLKAFLKGDPKPIVNALSTINLMPKKNIVQDKSEPEDKDPQPLSKESQKLFLNWQRTARANGDIPGGTIKTLARVMTNFLKNNPTHEASPKFAEMLTRIDTARDWKRSEAVKLLDEVSAIYPPLPEWVSSANRFSLGGDVVAGKPLPDEFKDAPWGESQPNGLRVAWLLEPRAAEHRLNTPLKSRVLFHNSGKIAVMFRALTWNQSGGHKALDARGANVNINSTYWTTIPTTFACRLAPGEFLEVVAAGIGVGANNDAEDWRNARSDFRVGAWIEAKEGDEVTFVPDAISCDGRDAPQVEGEPTNSAQTWWLKFIKDRLSLDAPLPADATERGRLMTSAVQDLFGNAPTSDELSAFTGDTTPEALDSLAMRLSQRSGFESFSGLLTSGPTKFKVLPVDPEAAKKPRSAINPGRYKLGNNTTFAVTRRPIGERIVNEAHLEFTPTDPSVPQPNRYPVPLPDEYDSWVAAWMRDGTVLWVVQKGKNQKDSISRYDFSNPASVVPTVFTELKPSETLPMAILNVLLPDFTARK